VGDGSIGRKYIQREGRGIFQFKFKFTYEGYKAVLARPSVNVVCVEMA
jgi:hypothetical protein